MIVIQFILRLLLYQQNFICQRKFWRQKFKVLQTDGEKDRKIFKKLSPLQIKEGDIVLVHKNQVVQFDMLVLAFSKNNLEQQQCSIQTFFIDEKNYIQKKNCIEKLQPKENINNIEQFRKYAQSLNFKLELCLRTKDGILKVSKDPKPEEVSKINIIFDNSEIKSDWILGVKISNQKSQIKKFYLKNFKKTKTDESSNILQSLFFVIIIIIMFANYAIQININYQKFNFIRSIMQTLLLLCNINFSLWLQIIEFMYLKFIKRQLYKQYNKEIINYKANKLISYKTFAKKNIVDQKVLYKKNKTQKFNSCKKKLTKLQQEEMCKIKKFKIYNYHTFTNLSNIGTIAMSQNNLISQQKFKVKSIAVGNNYYSIDYIEDKILKQSASKKNIKKKQENKIMYQSQVKNQKIQTLASFQEINSNPSDSINVEEQYQFMIKNELKIFEDVSNDIVLRKDKNLKSFLSKFYAFLNFKEFYLNKNNIIQTNCLIDQSLLEFFQNFDLKISKLFNDENQILKVKYKYLKNNQTRNILHIDNCFQTDKIRIIYKNNMDSQIKVILRTSDEIFVDKMQSEKEKYITQIKFQNKKENLQSQFFYHYCFDQDQSDNLQQQIKSYKMKDIDTYQLLSDILDNLELNFKFLGAVGLKEKVKVNDNIIKSFLDANFRICILSSNKSFFWKNFLDELNSPFQLIKINLEFEDVIQGKIYFQEIFQKYDVAFSSIINNTISQEQKIKLFFQQKTQIHFDRKFILFINNKTFELLLQDPFLFYNFKFLMYYSIHISCVGFNSEQKALIIQILQILEKNKSVLAIGQGIKDFQMMIQANISVQQKSLNDLKSADLVLQNWETLKQLMFIYAQDFKQKYIFIQINIMQNIFFFVIQVQMENLWHKSGINFLPCSSILIFIVLQILININVILQKNQQQAIYQNQILYNVIFCQNFTQVHLLFLLLIEAFIESIIIYNTVIFAFDGILISEKQITQEKIYLVVTFVNIIFLILRNLIILPGSKFQKFSVFIIQILIIYFVFQWDSYSNLSISFKNIFKDKNIIIVQILSLFIALIVVFIMIIIIQIIDKLQNIKQQEKQNDEYIVVNFLKKWYKKLEKQEFVAKLFQIYKYKQFIDLYLLNQIYTIEKLDNKNFLSARLLQMQIPFMEKNFYQNFYLKNSKKYLIILFIILFFNSFLLTLDQIYQEFLLAKIFFLPTIFLNLCCILIFFYTYKNIKYLIYFDIMLLLSEIVSRLIFMNVGQYFALLEIAQLILKSQIQTFSIQINIIMNFYRLATFIFFIIKIQKITNSMIIQILLILFYTIIVFYNFLHVFNQQKVAKKNVIMKHRLKKKKNYNTDLLTFLMPSFIINQLQYDMNDNYLASDAGEVSVMFLYIVNFDKILDYFKDDIITVLDTIYKDFDILCEKFGVQKIESVGNSYVAACGGQVGEQQISQYLKQQEPAKRIFDLSLAIMQIIEQHNKSRNYCFQLKIGIHTGKCMMGVIGYHKPQFSLIGDTINTTSRVCTTGTKDRIMLSKESFNILKKYSLDSKYKMETVDTFMKGKGQQEVYHIYKKPKFQTYIKKALFKLKKDQFLNKELKQQTQKGIVEKQNTVESSQNKKFGKRRTSKLLTIKALKDQGSFFNDKNQIKPVKSLKFNSITNNNNNFNQDKLKKKKTLNDYELYLERCDFNVIQKDSKFKKCIFVTEYQKTQIRHIKIPKSS